MDVFVSQPHYWDHLAPVAVALGSRVFTVRAPWNAEAVGWRKLDRHSDLSERVLVAGYPDVVTVERAGRRAVLLEHGAGQTYEDARYHPSYPGGQRRDRVDLFLCTNALVAAANSEAYPEIPVAVTGSPRLDVLERRRLEERVPSEVGAPVLGLAWHWPCRISREAGTAFQEFGEPLRRLSEVWPGPIVGTAHPRMLAAASRWYDRLGIETVASWAEMVPSVDVLSVDNSSVLFEASALGVPVVLVNSARWRRDVDHGLRFWDYVEVGPNVWPTGTPAEIGDRWAEACWSAYDEPYRYEAYASDMAAVVYPNRGSALQATLDALAS